MMSVSGVGAPYSSKDDDRQHQFSQPMKLKGRTEAPDERRGRTLSSRARGAQPPTVHSPLQTIVLEVSPMVSGIAVQQTANHLLVWDLGMRRVALEKVHASLA